MTVLSFLSPAALAALQQICPDLDNTLPPNPIDLIQAALRLAGCPDHDFDLGRSAEIGEPGEHYAAIWGPVLELEGLLATGSTPHEAAANLLLSVDEQRDDDPTES